MDTNSDSTWGIQSPSYLQVIDFQYKHVGLPDIWVGKVVVLPPDYRWLLELDDNPQAYGEVWEEFNDSLVIEYVDTQSGETLDGKLVQLLSPDPDNGGFHMLVTDDLIQQLTQQQVFKLWEAVWVRKVGLPQEENRPALTEKLWAAIGDLVSPGEESEESMWDESFSCSLDVLAKLGTQAMSEYQLGLTLELDPDTL